MMRHSIMIAMLAGLAACGGGSEAPRKTADPDAPATTTAAPNAAATDLASEAERPQTIPAAFHGRWGMTPGDCTSTRGDAKGLLVIDETTLRFYESRAVPREIERRGPNEWHAVLDYSGEGQSWSEATTVGLSNGGKTLTRMADGPWTYQRCEDAS